MNAKCRPRQPYQHHYHQPTRTLTLTGCPRRAGMFPQTTAACTYHEEEARIYTESSLPHWMDSFHSISLSCHSSFITNCWPSLHPGMHQIHPLLRKSSSPSLLKPPSSLVCTFARTSFPLMLHRRQCESRLSGLTGLLTACALQLSPHHISFFPLLPVLQPHQTSFSSQIPMLSLAQGSQLLWPFLTANFLSAKGSLNLKSIPNSKGPGPWMVSDLPLLQNGLVSLSSMKALGHGRPGEPDGWAGRTPASRLLHVTGECTFPWQSCPVHCSIFHSILGLHPPDPNGTTKSISKHCRIPLGEREQQSLLTEATGLIALYTSGRCVGAHPVGLGESPACPRKRVTETAGGGELPCSWEPGAPKSARRRQKLQRGQEPETSLLKPKKSAEAVPEGGQGWASPEKGNSLCHTQGRGGRGGYEARPRYPLCDLWNSATLSFTCYPYRDNIRGKWPNARKSLGTARAPGITQESGATGLSSGFQRLGSRQVVLAQTTPRKGTCL
ncbi:hypothetical protein Cadr_000017825 [Camelus dromedarius]|uniref:Uncharacterized protein n=1 Tax=Camelus dromedarius TaxID=9838 RepID=A0A5N4D6N9_CAMDR|nr:hypothetical protein Cadr_000017825 [Camelus dromedarius]